MKNLIVALLLLASSPLVAQECYDLSARSSWISSVCYNQGTMSISMNGKRYNFCQVPYEVFQGMLRASSPGSYYDSYIRGRYTCAGY